MSKTQCEGWRIEGSFMSLGNPQWYRCQNKGIVLLSVMQKVEGSKRRKRGKLMPACQKCWNECLDNKDITILKTMPINKEASDATS